MKKLRKILLIDDDNVTNYLNKSIIAELEIADNVEVIENGEDAFQYLKNDWQTDEYPDLILLDINMPIANGYEFLEAYKLLPNKKSKLIILSSSNLKKDVDRANTYGIDDYIVKPLDKDEFEKLLCKHFN